MIFGFCFSKNLKIQIVFFQMIHYFEHYFNIYISTSMDQILWNAPISGFNSKTKTLCLEYFAIHNGASN